MVSRKPLPPNATFDPAVPSHARSPEPKPEAQQEFVLPPFESTGGFWDDTSNNINQNQNTDAAQDMSNSHQPGQAAGNYAGLEEENVWANNNSSSNLDRVLTVLRPGSSHRMDNTGSLGKVAERTDAGLDVTRVPTILRPAGGPSSRETNPFKRKMHNQDGSANPASTSSTTPLPESLTGAFSDLAVGDTTKNPWQPALSDNSALGQRPSYQLPEPSPGMEDGWKGSEPPRPSTSTPPRLLSLPSEEGSAGWENERDKPPNIQLGFTAEEDEVLGDSHAWDDLSTVNKGNGTAAVPAVPDKGGSDDEWNLIDVDPPRSSQPNVQQSPSNSKPSPPRRRDTWEDFDEEKDTPQPSTSQQVAAPLTKDQPPPQGKAPELPARTELPPRTELPRRTSSEQPPPQPPRPVDKNETYHIKNINWFDITAAKNPRSTPILVQNANGPCPLVALVNALTLTTPADKNTALVDTLKTREQVSLGLLLDAVFDELMSERRLDPNVPLPDITQLYSFLQGLHTGMNVNPRFIPTESILQSFKRTSLTHIHPSQRGEMSIPGTFEHTKEMTLYSTFSIPLIHGWLPRPDDIVYQSFARQAASYEDVQNLLFREEELDDKLSSSHHHEGLTEEEQQLYQDILSIKSFLHSSATQLTNFGLEVIKKSMKPGSVAILFRNDHFATLYRHPQTLELLTLVTDAGYAGHAEVVWESLVDTTGEKAEFFSGDFRVVGGASHTSSTPAARTQGSGSWADVASSSGNRRSREQGRGGRSSSSEAPTSPTTEQEDRDFAMALQLQEEEDNRHRQEEDRRRREARLSEQYIEQQGRAAQAHNSRGGAGSGRGGSHAASRSTGSLGSSGTANTGRRAPSGIRVTSSTPTVASSNNSATPNRPRPSTQTVRSLIPPVQPAAAANRDPEAGLDDAPPSYEQASQQAAYEPPTGHPAHPASSPTAATSQPASTLGATQRPSTGASQPSPRVHNAPRTGGSAGGRAPNGSHGYPGAGGAGPGRQGLRQGVPVVPANGRSGVGEEREKCVVM